MPYPKLAVVAGQLAGFLGKYWQGHEGTIGWVGIAPEGQPILMSFAPRRDLLAQRLLANTVENPSHTYPQLWLSLASGVYLAQVLDPTRTPLVSLPALLALVDGQRVTELLFLKPAFLRRRFSLTAIWVQAFGKRWRSLHQLRTVWKTA